MQFWKSEEKTRLLPKTGVIYTKESDTNGQLVLHEKRKGGNLNTYETQK